MNKTPFEAEPANYQHVLSTLRGTLMQPYSQIVGSMFSDPESMGILGGALAALMPGANDTMPAMEYERRPGTYHLLKSGQIVTPDLPAPEDIGVFLTSLRAQSLQGPHAGGVLPNIARCVPPVDESGWDADTTDEHIENVRKDWLYRYDLFIDKTAHTMYHGT